MSTKNKESTRFYSNLQEERVAKTMNAKGNLTLVLLCLQQEMSTTAMLLSYSSAKHLHHLKNHSPLRKSGLQRTGKKLAQRGC